MNEITIGISDVGNYNNYEKWITGETGVNVIRLGYRYNNFEDIKRCHGLLLSGGQDVHPQLYNKPEYLLSCQGTIDEERDAFEWRLLAYAEAHDLPVLGICRGLQLANVFFGGTLIPDIDTSIIGRSNSTTHTKKGETDSYHQVQVKEASLLQEIVGLERGEINSAHHQSTDTPGEGLVANAISEDGIIEGLERKDPEGKPFLLLVQWHPERMNETESVFSKNIRQSFLEAVRKFTGSQVRGFTS